MNLGAELRSELLARFQFVETRQHLYGIKGLAEGNGSVNVVESLSHELSCISLIEEPSIPMTLADSEYLHLSLLLAFQPSSRSIGR